MHLCAVLPGDVDKLGLRGSPSPSSESVNGLVGPERPLGLGVHAPSLMALVLDVSASECVYIRIGVVS